MAHPAMQMVDLTGRVFGRLTVICRAPNIRTPSVSWRCRCECGHESIARSANLLSGNTQSCGCLYKKHLASVHGQESPEWLAWQGARDRCFSVTNKDYPRYGGRGITMPSPERDDFRCLFAKIGPRPSSEHTLDRADNDGPYSADNVRWSTKKEQANNRRTNFCLEVDGQSLTLTQAVAYCRSGVRVGTVAARIHHGWPLSLALILPVDVVRPHHRVTPGKAGRPKRTLPQTRPAP